MTTVLGFATRTPPIPVTVDTFETRRPETSPKVTTVLGFATRTPPIPVTVDTFETRRPETSPKVTTVLGFATRTPPIPVTVDTFVMRDVKSDDSSAFRDDFRQVRLSGMSDPPRTLCGRFANACGRLRTLCGHNATTSRRLLDPWNPTLKREPFYYAFGNMTLQVFHRQAEGVRLASDYFTNRTPEDPMHRFPSESMHPIWRTWDVELRFWYLSQRFG